MATPVGLEVNVTLTNLNGTPQQVGTKGRSLYNMEIINTSGADAYVQIFDIAAGGSISLGVTTPTYQIKVPSASSVQRNWPDGVPFVAGCFVCSTTAVNGNTGSANGVTAYVTYE